MEHDNEDCIYVNNCVAYYRKTGGKLFLDEDGGTTWNDPERLSRASRGVEYILYPEEKDLLIYLRGSTTEDILRRALMFATPGTQRSTHIYVYVDGVMLFDEQANAKKIIAFDSNVVCDNFNGRQNQSRVPEEGFFVTNNMYVSCRHENGNDPKYMFNCDTNDRIRLYADCVDGGTLYDKDTKEVVQDVMKARAKLMRRMKKPSGQADLLTDVYIVSTDDEN